MSTQVTLPSELAPRGSPTLNGEDSQGRTVTVLNLFNKVKRLSSEADAFPEKAKYQKNGILCTIAGVVLIVAAVAIVCYLRATIPATYVWPGISKLLVATGITGLAMSGLFLLVLAADSFQKASIN